jgi:class 3 adenylate cyclase
MQEGLRLYADRLCNEGKIPVEARVGVNTGEVVVRTIETGGHTEYTPVGLEAYSVSHGKASA